MPESNGYKSFQSFSLYIFDSRYLGRWCLIQLLDHLLYPRSFMNTLSVVDRLREEELLKYRIQWLKQWRFLEKHKLYIFEC